MDSSTLYLILACVFGFVMAWGVGANDVANAMGTSVGSRALTIRQAILIAALFEFLGALLAGGEVTDTIRKGIINTEVLSHDPQQFVLGMLACLLSAALWLGVASHYGWPVSTTHSIVGALVGFGAFSLGVQAIQWETLGYIGLSWLLSPALGAIVAFGLYFSVQRLILGHSNPLRQAQRFIPYYIFLSGLTVALVTLLNGLSHLGIHLSFSMSLIYAFCFAFSVAIIGVILVKKLKFRDDVARKFHFINVEKSFGILMLFTACAMAFAHGSNDVANAIGPMAAITNIISTGEIVQSAPLPTWVLFLGASGILIGLMTYGHKVIATVGSGITKLTPTRGFAATLAASAVVVTASGIGFPISTTHTLVGAILGVGLARGMNALNFNVLRTILLSWVITIPAGAILTITIYKLMLLVFI
ncbi:MAG: inorganic phosphate transporter [Gammaproteobacteria bacterium]